MRLTGRGRFDTIYSMKDWFRGLIQFCWGSRTSRLLTLLIVVGVLLVGVVFYAIGKESESVLVEQTLHRQQVIVRAGALSMEKFIVTTGKALQLLARDLRLDDEDLVQAILDTYIEEWGDAAVTGVVLIDDEGIVTHAANKLAVGETGASVADRAYFEWAQTVREGDVYVGAPIQARFGPSKGEMIIPVSVPVFREGAFAGVLTEALLLSDLAGEYLDPLLLSDQSQVLLFDGGANVVYSTQKELVEQNLHDLVDEVAVDWAQEGVHSLDDFLVTPREGKVILRREEGNRLLAAVAPMGVNGHRCETASDGCWFLMLVGPEAEALDFYWSMYRLYSLALVVLTLVMLLFGLFAVYMRRRVRVKWYERGFIAAQIRDGGTLEKGNEEKEK